MEFNIDEFTAHPSLELLNACKKEHLLIIADLFKISVSKQSKKQVLKSDLIAGLSEKGVLEAALEAHRPEHTCSAARLK